MKAILAWIPEGVYDDLREGMEGGAGMGVPGEGEEWVMGFILLVGAALGVVVVRALKEGLKLRRRAAKRVTLPPRANGHFTEKSL